MRNNRGLLSELFKGLGKAGNFLELLAVNLRGALEVPLEAVWSFFQAVEAGMRALGTVVGGASFYDAVVEAGGCMRKAFRGTLYTTVGDRLCERLKASSR